jgi:hypothetical protein
MIDFNMFLNLSLKEGQEILDEQYPGHRLMHVTEQGRRVIIIRGPDISVSLTQGE